MNELQTTDKKEPTEITTRQNMGFTELMQAARAFAKSSIVPTAYRNKPDDAFVALEWGMELGMKPMASLQNIYVVNGRPTLSSQSMAGLIKSQSDYRGIVFDSSMVKAKVTIQRALLNGTIETHTGEFTIDQAKIAGLTGKDNWKNYPQQMLEARALAFAARKAYPDLFAGIYSKEEVQDFGPGDFKATDKAEAPADIKPAEGQQTTPITPAAQAASEAAGGEDLFPGIDEAFDGITPEIESDMTPRGRVRYIRLKHSASLSSDAKTKIDNALSDGSADDDSFKKLYWLTQDFLSKKRGIEVPNIE